MTGTYHRTFLWLFVAVLILAGCAPAPAAQTGGDMEGMDHGDDGASHDMDAMNAGVESLKPLSGDEFEIAFLDSMIPHHQSAVEMAEIALERAQSEETRAAATAILAAQETEIAQMTLWLQEWHGRAPSGDDHGMAMAAETEALRTIPAEEFDAAFYNAMIPHHESAIVMSELIPDRTTRPELVALGDAIISAQRTEIAQYEAWLAQNESGS